MNSLQSQKYLNLQITPILAPPEYPMRRPNFPWVIASCPKLIQKSIPYFNSFQSVDNLHKKKPWAAFSCHGKIPQLFISLEAENPTPCTCRSPNITPPTHCTWPCLTYSKTHPTPCTWPCLIYSVSRVTFVIPQPL